MLEKRQSTSTNREMVPPALRTVFGIFDAWGLKVGEWGVLLGVSQPSVYRWKSNPEIAANSNSRDLVERLSYILGIYKALHILLPDPRSADTWINRPNMAPLFGGRPPRERIFGGHVADLFEVRRWLDGQRGFA